MLTLFQPLTITAIRQEIPGFKTFYFGGADTANISYQPGQYLTLVLPGAEPEVRRSYSIISAPDLNEPLAIGVKRIPNGIFSRWLTDRARPGDQVLTIGAGGFFTLPLQLAPFRQVFFFAAGSGITPCLSLIKTLLFTHPAIAVSLVYSNSTTASAIYTQELLQLQQQFPDRFKTEFLYSDSPNLSRARLYRELVITLVREYAIAPATELLCYVCGPEIYMRMVGYGLRNAGVLPENIKREIFTSQKLPPKIEPPDTKARQVTMHIRDQVFRFGVQYPETILKAARKNGVQLPYSCENGRCGNCVARCTEGKVWMSNNEVLTDRETEKGLVLTCVGYPVEGDVVLKV